MDSIFIEDLPTLSKGTEVEVRFPGNPNDPLSLICTVTETVDDLAFLRFNDLDNDQQTKLEALLCPNWDGADLLEGLLILSRRLPATNLEEWMRLTSIVARCRPGAIAECVQSLGPDISNVRNNTN